MRSRKAYRPIILKIRKLEAKHEADLEGMSYNDRAYWELIVPKLTLNQVQIILSYDENVRGFWPAHMFNVTTLREYCEYALIEKLMELDV
jgi:hypothetical protein